jgi:small-conductance mechanosensitive channel
MWFKQRHLPETYAPITLEAMIKACVALSGIVIAHLLATWASMVVVRRAGRPGQPGLTGLADTQKRKVAYQLIGSAAYWVVLSTLSAGVLMWAGLRSAFIMGCIGTVGVTVGLGLQGALGDVVSGMLLLVSNTYRIGDYIEAPALDITGTVTDFSLLYTRLRHANLGVDVAVPNRNLYGSVLVNHSSSHVHLERLEVTIANSNTNVPGVVASIERFLASHPNVLAEPPPLCGVHRITPLGTVLELRFSMTPDDWAVSGTLSIQSRILALLHQHLQQTGVSLAMLTQQQMVTQTAMRQLRTDRE